MAVINQIQLNQDLRDIEDTTARNAAASASTDAATALAAAQSVESTAAAAQQAAAEAGTAASNAAAAAAEAQQTATAANTAADNAATAAANAQQTATAAGTAASEAQQTATAANTLAGQAAGNAQIALQRATAAATAASTAQQTADANTNSISSLTTRVAAVEKLVIQSGSIQVACSTANEAATATLTFPTAYSNVIGCVVCIGSGVGSVGQDLHCACSSVTNTGCTISARRGNAGNVNVRWFAAGYTE